MTPATLLFKQNHQSNQNPQDTKNVVENQTEEGLWEGGLGESG